MPQQSPVRVDEGALLARLGPDATRFELTGASVVVGATEILIIADAGDDLASSGVWNESLFRLAGEVPEAAAQALSGFTDFWSFEEPQQRPIHVAVRVGTACLLLGGVRFGCGGPDHYEFKFFEPLDREVLDAVRPPGPDPLLPAPVWVGLVTDRPQQALTLFVESWFPESPPRNAAPSAEAVPTALAAFYRLAEGRPKMLGTQNYMHRPQENGHDRDGEYIAFASENQGCWSWSCPRLPDTGDSDHSVLLTRNGLALPEQEPLSKFLLQFLLHEATFEGPYLAHASAPADELLPKLRSVLRDVPLRPFMTPVHPMSFLAGPGLVAVIAAAPWNEGSATVGIGAVHRSALRPLGQLGIRWSRFDG
ncbi:hypothetical protein OG349_21645 [Streptomyces sp. NBC_01317]|uniref:hypothetical protein n=1 Tax=Streptomyces sp. NBC_01317 TaxID=2903822 RepID=UPI002E141B34|nr:hypothetical protein OG349_21645 [Streptomyces sp. NBC_01317]